MSLEFQFDISTSQDEATPEYREAQELLYSVLTHPRAEDAREKFEAFKQINATQQKSAHRYVENPAKSLAELEELYQSV